MEDFSPIGEHTLESDENDKSFKNITCEERLKSLELILLGDIEGNSSNQVQDRGS